MVVEGQVVNGTAGGGSVAGITVLLFRQGEPALSSLETSADSEGRFSFSGIEYDPALTFGVSVNYQGALYAEALDLSSGTPPPTVLTVYDTIQSDEVVSASAVSVVFGWADASAQTVSALEIVNVVNNSDRTYTPGPEPMNLLRFGLPAGTERLRVNTGLLGADFIQVDRGFALLASVPPGQHEVMFTYQFPYSGAGTLVSKSFRYGVQHLRILAPQSAIGISSDDLGETETVTAGETLYNLLEATELTRGTRVSIRLEGLPERSVGDGLRGRWDEIRFEYAAPVSLVLLMVVLIAYSLWRRAREGSGGAVEP